MIAQQQTVSVGTRDSRSSDNQSEQVSFPRMCCEEPFRLFFPLGLVSGIVGLVLWPLFLSGAMSIYPGIMHARLMIEGFMGAFIIGFLGTAGPRLLSAPHFTRTELGVLLTLYLSTVAAHLSAWAALGDGLFSILLASLIVILARRFVRRDELPPPNFVLVICGLLCGAAGAAVSALTTRFPDWPRLHYFGTLLLSQGFVLLPVLGVGVFLFPRFLGVPFGAELADLRRATPQWKRKAIYAAFAVVAFIGSFAIESAGLIRAAGTLRFASATAYVISQMPTVLKFGRASLLGQFVRVSVWLLLLGLLWPVFLPAYRVAGLHIVFIGGFMLAVFTVATRVMLGHSGQIHLCKRPLPFLIATTVLLSLGLFTRVSADFLSSVAGRNIHLIYAAILCIAAALVWGIRLVPRVFVPDTDEVPADPPAP